MLVILSLIFGVSALLAKMITKIAPFAAAIILVMALIGVLPWATFFAAVGIYILAAILSPLFIGAAQGFIEAQENKTPELFRR